MKRKYPMKDWCGSVLSAFSVTLAVDVGCGRRAGVVALDRRRRGVLLRRWLRTVFRTVLAWRPVLALRLELPRLGAILALCGCRPGVPGLVAVGPRRGRG